MARVARGQLRPFSQKTAWRYMECFDRRAELVTVTNLADAYALLLPPKKESMRAHTTDADGGDGVKLPVAGKSHSNGEGVESPQQSEPVRQRQGKSQKQIMKELQRIM